MSSVPYVVFDVQTGQTLRWGVCQAALAGQQARNTNECSIEAAIDPYNEYVDPITKEVMPLKTMNVSQADGAFTGLPIPCSAIVEGQTYIVGDGAADFDFNLPGTYEVVFRAAGYRDYNVTVTV